MKLPGLGAILHPASSGQVETQLSSVQDNVTLEKATSTSSRLRGKEGKDSGAPAPTSARSDVRPKRHFHMSARPTGSRSPAPTLVRSGVREGR